MAYTDGIENWEDIDESTFLFTENSEAAEYRTSAETQPFGDGDGDGDDEWSDDEELADVDDYDNGNDYEDDYEDEDEDFKTTAAVDKRHKIQNAPRPFSETEIAMHNMCRKPPTQVPTLQTPPPTTTAPWSDIVADRVSFKGFERAPKKRKRVDAWGSAENQSTRRKNARQYASECKTKIALEAQAARLRSEKARVLYEARQKERALYLKIRSKESAEIQRRLKDSTQLYRSRMCGFAGRCNRMHIHDHCLRYAHTYAQLAPAKCAYGVQCKGFLNPVNPCMRLHPVCKTCDCPHRLICFYRKDHVWKYETKLEWETRTVSFYNGNPNRKSMPYVKKKPNVIRIKPQVSPKPQSNVFTALQDDVEIPVDPVSELSFKMGVLHLGVAPYNPISSQRPRDRLTKPVWLLKREAKLKSSRSGGACQGGAGSMTRSQAKKVNLAKRQKKDDACKVKRVIEMEIEHEKKIQRVDAERALKKQELLDAMMPPIDDDSLMKEA